MRSRTFLNVSLGILALALAYHLGARSATAQASGSTVAAAFGQSPTVVTTNGDVYSSTGGSYNGPWVWTANVFSGVTPVHQQSLGSVKVRYR